MVDTQIQHLLENTRCLYTAEQLDQRIITLADEISQTLQDTTPLLYCVMNGGLIFTGKLMPHLHFPLQQHYLHATRYGDKTHGGNLEWRVKPTESLTGRTVLLLDDVYDEGHTLLQIADYCLKQGADKVYTAVLIDKQHQRKANPKFAIDFVGFESEDFFLFGYGMDYQGYWRNAPGIYAITS